MGVNSVKKRIPLTKNVTVDHGAHVVYFYNNDNVYFENLVSFIMNAKTFNHKVVYIDSTEHYQKVLEILKSKLSEDEIKDLLYYQNNYDFYEMYGDFHFERVLTNFKNTVQPFVDDDIEIRVWGHVDWGEQSKSGRLGEEVGRYESQCDLTLSELGYITVCCYNGMVVPAYIQTEVLRSHEYFMTDEELVRSNLYKQSNSVVFPSISAQTKMDNEIDFYKQKLDFIHVVSHEVRNPLTIIKAFAAILASEVTEDEKLQKLQVIQDNVEAIDYEINHIIQTEQMLTTESLWKTKLVNVYDSITETISILEIKARTQNIDLDFKNELDRSIVIKGNKLAFKLVFSNLISNAIKYSYEGSRISVHIYKRENEIVFAVKDNGIGMTEVQLEKLFSKYEKMNDEKPGQGIGMFMVKKITDAFDGKITIESELKKGTEVIVKFPIN